MRCGHAFAHIDRRFTTTAKQWLAGRCTTGHVRAGAAPARPKRAYEYAVAVAYIQAFGDAVAGTEQQWIMLIEEFKALRVTTYHIADRLRDWRE